ncbi:MAG: glycosyltransferase [Thermoguttaceae bacterium]
MNAVAKRIAKKVFPAGTRRNQWARSLWRRVRRLGRPASVGEPASGLMQILQETQDRKGIVIYPPFIDWTWMRQRPHQLMREFAEAGYLSLFCSPLYKTDSFRGFVRVAERLYLCDSLAPLYALPDPILLISWTGHWEATKRFHWPTVIYDYLDDLGVSAEGGVPNGQKLDLHRKAVSGSQVVLATARRLYDEVRRVRPDAIYCPNGVDYDHFHLSAAPPVPGDIADLVAAGRPVVGYYGALARWFDYDLVVQAAQARPDCQFLLIGPDHENTVAGGRLDRASNIRWLGEKRYEELPAYLYYFDVATIPFVVNDITRATSPIKLFEYMAAGKPVVTTDLPECCGRNGVLVARDPQAFITLLGEAIASGRQDAQRRMLEQEAERNRWRARAAQIIDRLGELRGMRRRRSA